MPELTDGLAPSTMTAGDTAVLLFNGSTFDRSYNSVQGILVPSASRLAAPAIATQSAPNHRGVILWLNITAGPGAGVGGLTVTLRALEPVTGTAFVALLTGVQVVGQASYPLLVSYLLYPGAVTGPFTLGVNGNLPRVWTANVAHLDGTNAFTYSLAYSLLL
jgi:hypothetical protein